ncbi:hypothetical protein G6F56_007775 [Rhizopus delemar]|nr:hypothetical protein G6F56_007775 [Rhizopus delemar]
MNPLIHSPTQTSSKFRWSNLKTLLTPDFNKRRPFQYSITNIPSSTNHFCQKEDIVHPKRPSLTGSDSLHIVVDKCMSHFRRRTSNASSVTFNLELETNKVLEMYQLALDELNYAQDSRGSLYYSGDLVAAEEAIVNYTDSYKFLLEQCSPEQQEELQITLGSKLNQLSDKLKSLPQQEDQRSI